ncbi:HypC/HybG/HupF family hydrogenase formation chaperone [bacterium]|nr:HypC/HybG/HupF family hydrogenase formation chaperone [bacterium]
MCLAVPMKVLKIYENKAIAEFGGLRKEVNIELVSSLKEGDYIIVHAGCAIEKLDKKYAQETLNLLAKLTF